MPKLQIDDTKTFDASKPTLHLLPALQIDPFDRVAPEDISLSVLVKWGEESISPDTSWIIHQPYPNQLYFVGGSELCQLGDFITLPEVQQAVEVIFQWTVKASELPPGHFQITQRLNLALKEGKGHTWSMDVANWWHLSEHATEKHNTPEIGRNRFARLKRQGISPKRHALLSETLRDGCHYFEIQESVDLPAITLNDCWTVNTYGGKSAGKYLEALR